ncbi:unnamed protein product [Adineta steineri]|uniref:Carrier domain-containing protein n=1 Tax=Adineta steineri TaxID=433720 RepID=A0A813ZXX7_9BILA|nr:unnamed protein product [Adineta steineri]
MFQLRSDCSLHVIDFIALADHISPLIRFMFAEAIQLFVQRKLRAVDPAVAYEPSQIIEALLRCNSGQVMGKTVFCITSSDQLLNINKNQSNNLLEVMIIQYFHQKFKRTTKKYNARVDVVQADVTNFQQVHDLIERFQKTSYTIRGIIHSAVVAEDRTLNNLTQEHLLLVLSPKVRGAWYLHQATQLLHAPIYFFIMLSSIRNHLLEVASAGYNVGNQFLDALAHYRFTSFNLPVLSISLPDVSGSGMFHRHKEMLSTLSVTQGFESMPTVTVFELIKCFHQTQKICPCPVIFAVNCQILHRKYSTLATSYLTRIVGARHKEMKFDQISSSGKNNSTESTMNKKETISERIQATVVRLLDVASVDRIVIDRSLVSQGMDSLAAVSLSNWLGQETHIYIPLSALLQGLSIETIATLIYNKLNEKEQKTSLSATKEYDSDFDLINETTYIGLEDLIYLRRSNENNTSTLFCITQISNDNNNEDLFTLFIQKLSNQKNKISSNDIYALQILSSLFSSSISTYAHNLITQMCRIPSCGSCQIVATRNKPEETIAHGIKSQALTSLQTRGINLTLSGVTNIGTIAIDVPNTQQKKRLDTHRKDSINHNINPRPLETQQNIFTSSKRPMFGVYIKVHYQGLTFSPTLLSTLKVQYKIGVANIGGMKSRFTAIIHEHAVHFLNNNNHDHQQPPIVNSDNHVRIDFPEIHCYGNYSIQENKTKSRLNIRIKIDILKLIITVDFQAQLVFVSKGIIHEINEILAKVSRFDQFHFETTKHTRLSSSSTVPIIRSSSTDTENEDDDELEKNQQTTPLTLFIYKNRYINERF